MIVLNYIYSIVFYIFSDFDKYKRNKLMYSHFSKVKCPSWLFFDRLCCRISNHAEPLTIINKTTDNSEECVIVIDSIQNTFSSQDRWILPAQMCSRYSVHYSFVGRCCSGNPNPHWSLHLIRDGLRCVRCEFQTDHQLE